MCGLLRAIRIPNHLNEPGGYHQNHTGMTIELESFGIGGLF